MVQADTSSPQNVSTWLFWGIVNNVCALWRELCANRHGEINR